ncbi:hypothetical protein [Dickeya ananatis]|uniref:hypothetical protein n=1 Tax=Dickeya ananatis TaxID=3061286 RepID=UPI0038911135
MQEEKTLTPVQFWTSVKVMAESNIAELKQVSHLGLDGKKQHHEAMSNLSSLLKGQA